ncbi:MAG TPA: 50S ribosomal protein L17 [Candidatus Pacearchaeota archaeon]|nr:50S ribosomal protein L17 [Candidatus Pacearchaeota archaeon]
MYKRNKGKKFSRKTDQRGLFLKSLAESLILHGKIKTTLARAKAIRSIVEKLITRAKKSDVATIRFLNARVNQEAAKKLIKELGPKYATRNGGYSRITKIGQRMSDSAAMAFIELI